MLDEGYENFTNCFSPKPSTTISRGIANIALESTINLEKVAKLHRTGAGMHIIFCKPPKHFEITPSFLFQPFTTPPVLGEASCLREITATRPSPTKYSSEAFHGTLPKPICWRPFVHLAQFELNGQAKKVLACPRATCT